MPVEAIGPVEASGGDGAASPVERRIFWALLLIGLALRLTLLGHASYQIDEVNVVRDATAASGAGEIYRTELARFLSYRCLPFFLVPIRWSAQLFHHGDGLPAEWIARLPFALIGVATLPILYALGCAVRNRRAGLWAMGMAACSVFHLYYSREAYAYSFLIFFAAASLWTGVELLRRMADPAAPPAWRWAAAFALAEAGLLQSHLTALPFVAAWNVGLVVGLLLKGRWGSLFRGVRPLFWLLAFGIPLALFWPFLVRILTGSYTSTDTLVYTVYFTWAGVPALIGRMGWGEGGWVLWPFAAVLVVGVVALLRGWKDARRWTGVLLVGQLVLYFALQAIIQERSKSRFEVRYYSALFPLLVVIAAVGLEGVIRAVSARLRMPRAGWVHATVAAALLLWLAPSIHAVTTLHCRGYDYKRAAEWVMRNVPERGAYAMFSVYELRGVPGAYPTPGRMHTFVSANSTAEDNRLRPPARLAERMFTRFPLVPLIEVAPNDELSRLAEIEPPPRERLFMRSERLGDPSWHRLLRLKTFPPGEVQLNAADMDKLLISWNEPEDLPALAARRGERFYGVFGPEWLVHKDQQLNDWAVLQGAGVLVLGHVGEAPESALVRLPVMAPAGGVLTVYGPDGVKLIDHARIGTQPTRLELPPILLPPGETRLRCEVQPLRGQAQAPLFAAEVQVMPAP